MTAYFDHTQSARALDLLFPHRPDLALDDWTTDCSLPTTHSGRQTEHDILSMQQSKAEDLQTTSEDAQPPFWITVRSSRADTPVLVAVRGTDFLRVADYIEDIRMWTDPVCLSLLGICFPTIRVWPVRTAAMFIDSLHAILEQLGVPDTSFKYERLLSHVRALQAQDKQVF